MPASIAVGSFLVKAIVHSLRDEARPGLYSRSLTESDGDMVLPLPAEGLLDLAPRPCLLGIHLDAEAWRLRPVDCARGGTPASRGAQCPWIDTVLFRPNLVCRPLAGHFDQPNVSYLHVIASDLAAHETIDSAPMDGALRIRKRIGGALAATG
jgi:hypothetical protein